ncbi:tetratricopeptide repeat protein [Treponema pedis]|uniref:tetratricopeptide repeat protein n=1 Tax=Treponema pedis TaxID=409322 RepID=UPI003D1D6A4E
MIFFNKIKTFFIFGLFFLYSFFTTAQDVRSAETSAAGSVNIAAAIACLNNSSNLYFEGKWEEALFEAQLGEVYDPQTADFLYIEALCALKLNYPFADALEKAEAACASGMVWRLYDLNSARLLCAEINCKIMRYGEALSLIKLLPFSSAKSDYIRAAAFYGFGRDEEARAVINEAMTRWTFTPDFAKLFFIMERGKKITGGAKRLAEHIIERLYIWQDEDPSLLIFASPFEAKSEENIRRLKIYRNMYLPFTRQYGLQELYNHSYSILLCLRYGIIDEQTAVTEFFNLTSTYYNPVLKTEIKLHTMYESHLIELMRIIGSPVLREKIRETLSSYEGLLLDDENGDLTVDSKIYYKNGRPLYAEFDTLQDGYPEYSVECAFGIPVKIYGKRREFTVTYDEYPSVKNFASGEKLYVMRPRDLKWKPVQLTELNLQLYKKNEKQDAFFSLKINKRTEKLHERYLTYSSVYSEEPFALIEGGIKKVFFDKGVPIKAEITSGEILYSKTDYKKGLPFLELIDKNGDGYFETLSDYDSNGELRQISIDSDKNKFYEYIEIYNRDDSVIKTWDSDEDGKIEITHIQYKNGNSVTSWIHPQSKQKISVYFENGIPVSLEDGSIKRKIVVSGEQKVYWLKNIPDIPQNINKKIAEIFNQNELPVVSYMFSVNEFEVFAVRSGGLIFAEITGN